MDIPIKEDTCSPYFVQFSFLKDNNLELDKDYVFNINSQNNDTLKIFIPGNISLEKLCPHFKGEYKSVFVDDIEQIPGVSRPDFSHQIVYTLYGRNGNYSSKFVVIVTTKHGIPVVDINTGGKAESISKEDYIPAEVHISNCPRYGDIIQSANIKGRGNWTWKAYPKKPYKIKFLKKESPFGWPADKEWTLLADYCDKSLLRTSCTSIVASLIGLSFPVHYKHVELFLDGEYQGIYTLTDVVEKSPNRISVSDDGFVLEDQEYYKNEPFYFTTQTKEINYTFEYPKPGKGISYGDDNYMFAENFMNSLEEHLTVGSDKIDKFINLHSFAKWYIAAELTGNYEPNLYYVMANKGAPIELYPLWDAEWSFGITGWDDDKRIWLKDINWDDLIWANRKYFKELFKYQPFITAVQEEWRAFYAKEDTFETTISNIKDDIKLAQVYNFEK